MHYTTTELWDLLREQGRTMAWFARATHYSREHLYRIKRGDVPITDEFARAAAAALGLPLAVLFVPVESPKVREIRTEDGGSPA